MYTCMRKRVAKAMERVQQQDDEQCVRWRSRDLSRLHSYSHPHAHTHDLRSKRPAAAMAGGAAASTKPKEASWPRYRQLRHVDVDGLM